MTDNGQVVIRGAASGFAQQITAGRHQLAADEPTALGGTDTGPTPYDLILAALGACMSMTAALYARKKGWALADVSVTLNHSRIHAEDCERCETEEGMLDSIQGFVTLTGDLSDEQRSKLIEIAKRCPVHRTLTSEIVVDVSERR